MSVLQRTLVGVFLKSETQRESCLVSNTPGIQVWGCTRNVWGGGGGGGVCTWNFLGRFQFRGRALFNLALGNMHTHT